MIIGEAKAKGAEMKRITAHGLQGYQGFGSFMSESYEDLIQEQQQHRLEVHELHQDLLTTEGAIAGSQQRVVLFFSRAMKCFGLEC